MASNASATIPALSAQPSKAEEIEYIEAVTRSLPVDSYLYRILAGVATYATVQINNDHGIGLIEKIDYEQGRREKAEEYCRARDGIIERLDGELRETAAGIARQNENLISVSEECQRMTAIAIREKTERESAEATIKDLEAQIEVLEANEAIRSAERQLAYQKTKYEEAAARLQTIREAA